jgi:hypothetical protein
MKKTFIFLVVALMALPALQAQEFFKMGAKGGLNFSTLVGDAEDAEMLTSFHLGLVAEIPISENFYFGPEVLYSMQGASFSDNEFDIDAEFKLDYIQIPLMVRYYVSEGFSLEAGPQIGFLTSSEVETEDIGVNTEDYFSSFDYGLNFGLGYKLPGGIFFQGRYNLGLANVLDSEEFGDDKSQNSVIQLSVGYMF